MLRGMATRRRVSNTAHGVRQHALTLTWPLVSHHELDWQRQLEAKRSGGDEARKACVRLARLASLWAAAECRVLHRGRQAHAILNRAPPSPHPGQQWAASRVRTVTLGRLGAWEAAKNSLIGPLEH